jgi:cation diffusion facilitator CzcD-associated flavoprotein CzcO
MVGGTPDHSTGQATGHRPDDVPGHVDVLVVGAGVSGIGAGYHLQTECPDRSYAIVEARSELGGTWDLFRYPGVRSDSDMHTLGYRFKPWRAARSIADGPSILAYLQETAAEFGIDRHIHYNRRVTAARWSSDEARWTVTLTHTDGSFDGAVEDDGTSSRSGDHATTTVSCNFLFMCAGYYSYRGGHRPEFPGEDRFTGTIVHPQEWPEDLDHGGKRVAIIGSGATAMTLVPAMAGTGRSRSDSGRSGTGANQAAAEHVTMIQRSPTYVLSLPGEDPVAKRLRRFLPERLAYRLIRRKNVKLVDTLYKQSRSHPDQVRRLLLAGVRRGLGSDYDIDTHFTPHYNPWDQRLCLIPDGDLFHAIRSGRASVVTGEIETFTEAGVRVSTADGATREVAADIIVTATGLELVTLGEADFEVDGEPVDFSRTWTYKGVCYSDVPNLASTFGYVNASWTLRADLVSGFVCRVLNHLRDSGTDIVVPRLRPSDQSMTPRPWIADFPAGYMRRGLPLMPRQGDREPWVNTQDYYRDRVLLGKEPVDDGVLRYSQAAPVTV